jgi:hypothetical protein
MGLAGDEQPKEHSANGHRPGPPWPKLHDDALAGLPGEATLAILPHTEADKVAVLFNLLAAFGNAAGRGAFVRVGADRHRLNLFGVLVGRTSKARKGMSWGHVRELMHAADAPWEEERVMNGLSSGEGLIYAVRDRVEGVNSKGEQVILDAGADDKRLLVMEGEFASVLKQMSRDGNILSPVARQAWDGIALQSLTRNSPLRATGAHVSIVGHVTRDELLKYLTATEGSNGFANRFLWLLVKRSKVLPFGGDWPSVNAAPLVKDLSASLEFARNVGELAWGETARPLWYDAYKGLSEGNAGLYGSATGRAEAQVLRLAAIYAVMDRSPTIEAPHLRAALALWRYADESALNLFAGSTGDPVADRIAEELDETGDEGLTRTEINRLFGGHTGPDRIAAGLEALKEQGRARSERRQTKGRPVERWFPVKAGADKAD